MAAAGGKGTSSDGDQCTGVGNGTRGQVVSTYPRQPRSAFRLDRVACGRSLELDRLRLITCRPDCARATSVTLLNLSAPQPPYRTYGNKPSLTLEQDHPRSERDWKLS